MCVYKGIWGLEAVKSQMGPLDTEAILLTGFLNIKTLIALNSVISAYEYIYLSYTCAAVYKETRVCNLQ